MSTTTNNEALQNVYQLALCIVAEYALDSMGWRAELCDDCVYVCNDAYGARLRAGITMSAMYAAIADALAAQQVDTDDAIQRLESARDNWATAKPLA